MDFFGKTSKFYFYIFFRKKITLLYCQQFYNNLLSKILQQFIVKDFRKNYCQGCYKKILKFLTFFGTK